MLRLGGAARSNARRSAARLQLAATFTSSAARELPRRYTSKVPTPAVTSSRSPRCRSNCADLRCTWPNPCPCFPWAATGPDQKAKPDYSPALLSSASKEKMYQMHKRDPQVNNPDKLAAEFRIRKQRVLAILWLKEMEKAEEAKRGAPLDDRLEKLYESLHPTFDKGRGEKHVTGIEVDDDGCDGKTKEEYIQEVSAKEEQMLVDEFVDQMEYTKKRVSGAIPSKHQRPAEGWSYTLEILDDRRGRSGGRRYVAEPNGTRRGLNSVEKVLTAREKILPRRKRNYVFVKPGQLISLKNIGLSSCLKHGAMDLYAGKVEGHGRPFALTSVPLPKHHLWHGVREWPPGLLHVYPKRNQTVSRMVKAFPTLKAFRPKSAPQAASQAE